MLSDLLMKMHLFLVRSEEKNLPRIFGGNLSIVPTEREKRSEATSVLEWEKMCKAQLF